MIGVYVDGGVRFLDSDMKVTETLTTARDHHVTAFVHATAGLGPCHVEPALRLADGTLAVDGIPPTPLRVDLIVKHSGERIAIESTPKALTAAIHELTDGVDIEIGPFAWNQATFDARGVGVESNERILEWFLRWFDPEDTNLADATGLYGVVHYMSDVTAANGGITFTLDLGSAPISAVDDLFSVLTNSGATAIRVR